MGQSMSSMVGFIIVFCLRMKEQVQGAFGSKPKESQYFNHNNIIKDDEQPAGK